MNPLIALLSTVLPGLLDKVIPDPEQADKAKLELLKLQQNGELTSDLAQIELNKIGAAEHPLVYGGRPAILWICAFGLFYEFLLRPLLPWVLSVSGASTVMPLPPLDSEALWTLTVGMLGLSGLRTYEKRK